MVVFPTEDGDGRFCFPPAHPAWSLLGAFSWDLALFGRCAGFARALARPALALVAGGEGLPSLNAAPLRARDVLSFFSSLFIYKAQMDFFIDPLQVISNMFGFI